MHPPPHTLIAATASACALLVGCASAPLDAEWKSPQARALAQPVRLLVACDAGEAVIARLCADAARAAFEQRGVAVLAAESDTSSGPTTTRDTALAAEARRLGASAVWVATLRPEAIDAERRSSFSIGIGGFGIGGHGGGGVGVGVSAPLDLGGRSPPRYAGDARLVAPADATLHWTARTGARASGDAATQVQAIVERLVDGGVRAGMY